MDPFQNLFQTVGNAAQGVGSAIAGGVQQGVSDLGTVLQNAKNTIKKIGDTAATQAAQEPDPAKKAQLHAVASDAYGTVAPSLGTSPTSGASANLAPVAQPKGAMNLPAGRINVPQGPMTATPTANTSAQATPQTTIPIEQRSQSQFAPFFNSPAGQAINAAVQVGNTLMSQEGKNISTAVKDPGGTPMAQAFDPHSKMSQQDRDAYMMGMVSPDDVGGGGNIPKSIEDILAAAERGEIKEGTVINPDNTNSPSGQFLDAQGKPMFNPSGTQSISEPLPENPSGTRVQFNKDGTETVIPPSEVPNSTQYAQQPSEETTPQSGAQMANGESATGSSGELPPRPPFSPEGYQKPQNPMIPSEKASFNDNRRYQSVFQIPSAITSKMAMKPEAVVNTLVHDGVTGVNLDELENTANEVTGGAGALANINRYALSKVPTMISYSGAQSAVDGLPVTMEGEPKGVISLVQREVKSAFQPVNYENTPATLPSHSGWAEHLFDVSQNLGDTVRLLQKKALDVNGDEKNPEYMRAADAVKEIKDRIDSSIDGATHANYQDLKTDPYVQGQLQRVPAPLAQRWVDNAKSFKNGQTVQWPYATLKDMLRYTKDKRTAVASQLVDELRGKLPSARAGETAANVTEHITNPLSWPKTLGKVVGKGVQAVASRYDPGPQDVDRFLTTPQEAAPSAQMTNGEPPVNPPGGGGPPPGGSPYYQQDAGPGIGRKPMGNGAKSLLIGGGLITAGALGYLGAKSQEQQSNAYSGPDTKDTQQNHTDSIGLYDPKVNSVGKIPQSMDQMSQNSDGTYQMTNIYNLKDSNNNSLFVDPTTAKQEQQKLDDAENSVEYKNAPNGAYHIAIDKQQALLNTQVAFNNNTKVGNSTAIDAYTKVAGISQAAMTAVDQLNKYAPALGNVSKTYNEWQQISGGQYNALIEQLKTLQSYGIPIPDTTRFTATGLASALIQAQGQAVQNFHTDLSASLGYTGDQSTNNVQQTNAIPSTAPAAALPGQSTQGAPGMFGSQFFNNQ
jgi:hypothetical protein